MMPTTSTSDADRDPESEPLLDDLARLRAVAVEQERHQKEPHAARDKGEHHKEGKTVAGKPRRDGDDLIGDRGDALEQDDQAAPARIGSRKASTLLP